MILKYQATIATYLTISLTRCGNLEDILLDPTGSPVCTIKTYKLLEGLIQGWGMEDVDLHQKFVNHKNSDVFRAADPGVLHVYHQIKCDPELPSQRLTQCKNSRASIIANQTLLLRYIMAIQQKDPRFHYKL